jgi:5-methylcytosine-specific restriction endonuclease McrA
MQRPFSYPKTLHSRTPGVPVYTSYKSYKKYLRADFGGQCVYCRMPDSIIGTQQFGADHYRPKLQFPHLAAVYANLFYCCNACNSRKGDAWDSTGVQFVPNPVDHLMFKHLRYKHAVVVDHSDAGKYTIELLDLNDDETVSYRENILHTISVLEEALDELKQLRKKAENARKASKINDAQFDAAMLKLQPKFDATQKALARWYGTV